MVIENNNNIKIITYNDFIKKNIQKKTNVQYLMGQMLINTESNFMFHESEYDKIICINEYNNIKKGTIGTFKINNNTIQKNKLCEKTRNGYITNINQYNQIINENQYELKMNDNKINIDSYEILKKNFEMPFNYAFECNLHMSPGKAYHASDKNPRTCVMIDKYDNVIFIVIEGRHAPNYNGLKFHELANVCKSLDAKIALNIDGGGSSCMNIFENMNLIKSTCAYDNNFFNYIQIKLNSN